MAGKVPLQSMDPTDTGETTSVSPNVASEASYYHQLVKDMDRARDLAIFRRFDEINLLRLLSLQAEVIHLHEHFKRCCKDDKIAKKGYERNFLALRQSPRTSYIVERHKCEQCGQENELHRPADPEEGSSQYERLQTLGKKMAEYNALLLQVAQLAELAPPSKSMLKRLKQRIREPRYKINGQSFLKGAEYLTWNENDEHKYYSLDISDAEKDAFTGFIKTFILTIYNLFFGSSDKRLDPESQLYYYEHSPIDTASGIISLIISTTLPVVTVFVLNALSTTSARIGFTALFTAVFALLLSYFTSAKRVEVFAATATFAAVEVVFIGSALDSGA